MPDNAGYLIRPLLPSEATFASQFSSPQANKSGYVSTQFCLHHLPTIFICLDDNEEWKGMIVTYGSPVHAGIAVVESITIADEKNISGVGNLLLSHSLQYYKAHCVFKIEIDASAINSELESLLAAHFFKATEMDGGNAYRLRLLPEKICLHNRKMRPSMNTVNGEVSEDTLFEYFQKDDIIWGTYSGGVIQKGVLLGRMARNGDIDFEYLQVNTSNEVNTGVSHSATEFLNDGRIILYEDWEWTGNRSGGGRSVIEEIKD